MESTYIYPIIESVHVLSLCSFVGLLLSWDLRLLGIMRRVAVSEVWARLIPWITMGAVLMVFSERRIVDWDTAAMPPRAATLAGAISIGLWAAIVVTGRFVAYNWFSPLV